LFHENDGKSEEELFEMVEYIMDSFPILAKRETKEYGEYRMKQRIVAEVHRILDGK
jgi:hypothetical protein